MDLHKFSIILLMIMNSVHIKLVVVGDIDSHKTLFLSKYTANKFPEDYEPIAFDNVTIAIEVQNKKVELQLSDTSGQQQYEKLRLLSYVNSDIILILFSLKEKKTFTNALTKWLPEVKGVNSKAIVSIIGVDFKEGKDDDMGGEVGGELQHLKCFYRRPDKIVEETIQQVLKLKAKKVEQTEVQCTVCQLI